MKLEFSRQSFGKVSNIKFHLNPPVGAETDRQMGRWTDMTKLIVAFHNFVNAPKEYREKKRKNSRKIIR